MSVKKLRDEARAAPQVPQTEQARLDRQDFLTANIDDALKQARTLGLARDHVLVIADSRDTVARKWMLLIKSEDEIRQHEAACMGRVIATLIFSVPWDDAIALSATHSPRVSETLERISPKNGRAILAISSGGSTLVQVPDDAARAPAKR
jgi:hypothetical protein